MSSTIDPDVTYHHVHSSSPEDAVLLHRIAALEARVAALEAPVCEDYEDLLERALSQPGVAEVVEAYSQEATPTCAQCHGRNVWLGAAHYGTRSVGWVCEDCNDHVQVTTT